MDPDAGLTEEERSYLQIYLDGLEALPVYSDGERRAYTISAMAGDRVAGQRLTESYLKHVHKEGLLPLASPQTFTREILRSIPPAALVLCREGMKACTDKMLPYIHRTYDDLASNDIWVCDNHTFDVFINDGEHEAAAD